MFCLEIKHFRWIFTFLKQLKNQILGFTVSKATLICKQKYMNAIFCDQFYRRYILELFKNLVQQSAVSFENLFFTILPGHILYVECPFGHSYGRTYKAQLSSKSRRTEAVFHLNNRLNSPLNLKEI